MAETLYVTFCWVVHDSHLVTTLTEPKLKFKMFARTKFDLKRRKMLRLLILSKIILFLAVFVVV